MVEIRYRKFRSFAMLAFLAGGGSACAQNNAIFNGGNADGFSTASFALPVSNAIFPGGIADGFATASYAQAVSNTIFSGGSADGFANGTFVQPYVSAIFQGGNGDGWSSATGAFGVLVKPLVFLEGPYVQASTNMSDNLRSAGLVPLIEPYTAAGYAQVGGGGEITTAAILGATGATAVVDWIRIELRDPLTPSILRATRQALLCRDGSIVSASGSQSLSVPAAPGNYFLVVRHRNHLGAMLSVALALSAQPLISDLTLPTTTTYGTAAQKNVGGRNVLWAGDASGNGMISYTGSGNDRDPILTRIGGTTPNNVTSGYYPEDVNLNGIVQYTGAGNDRDIILVNVGSTAPNTIRLQQLP